MPRLVFEVGSDDNHDVVELGFVAGNGDNATFQRNGVHTALGVEERKTAVIPAEKVLSMTMIWDAG
jgi:hypothetical protein